MRSTDRWLPRIATASAPTTLPMNAVTSGGASIAAHRAVTHSTASPAPMRSTTRVASAGTRVKPFGRGVVERPALPRRDHHARAVELRRDVLGHFLVGQLLVPRLERDFPLGEADVVGTRVLRDHVEPVVARVRLGVDGQEPCVFRRACRWPSRMSIPWP